TQTSSRWGAGARSSEDLPAAIGVPPLAPGDHDGEDPGRGPDAGQRSPAVTTSFSGVIRPPLIGLRSMGQDETAATMSTRHPRTIRSPGLDGAGLNWNSPSGLGGVLMNTLIGSGSRHSWIPYGVSASSRFIR